jgi:hypothetical protein
MLRAGVNAHGCGNSIGCFELISGVQLDVSLIFSTGGLKTLRFRTAVELPPANCAASVRVSVSGLYWKMTTLASGWLGLLR